jgi:hypothetical protein
MNTLGAVRRTELLPLKRALGIWESAFCFNVLLLEAAARRWKPSNKHFLDLIGFNVLRWYRGAQSHPTHLFPMISYRKAMQVIKDWKLLFAVVVAIVILSVVLRYILLTPT